MAVDAPHTPEDAGWPVSKDLSATTQEELAAQHDRWPTDLRGPRARALRASGTAERLDRATDPGSPLRLAHAYKQLDDDLANEKDRFALSHVVHTVIKEVDGADWVSLTLKSNGVCKTVAATDHTAELADRLQHTLGEGPCVAADGQASTYLANDLSTHHLKWPAFTSGARHGLGVNSILSVRLELTSEDHDDTVARLNLYGPGHHAYSDLDIATCTLLAVHAAEIVDTLRQHTRRESLEVTLRANREIDLATGILMEQHKIDADQAFLLLRVASQHTNRKLPLVAADVIRSGTLPLPAPGDDASPT